jgi:hypothetical protein
MFSRSLNGGSGHGSFRPQVHSEHGGKQGQGKSYFSKTIHKKWVSGGAIAF